MTADSAGFDTAHLGAIRRAVDNRRLRNLHAVVVMRHGRLVFEDYFTGRDEAWGRPLGEVKFGPDTIHDVRSVTKSIVSLLFGIAQAQGMVGSIDRPLLDAFPEFADLQREPTRMKILVKHALTMTMGTEWDETISYADPSNSERRMEDASDRYRFVLDRPIVLAPGERWNYNGGATAVIAKIVSRGAGRSLDAFAKEHLFGPLGITETEWITDRAGEAIAASGLRLRPRDLAKIGQLVLDHGRWDDREIVPKAWLDESTRPRIDAEPGVRYGYFWWTASSGFGDAAVSWVAGFGNGGQRVFVIPELDLVVVVTAGNYNEPEQWRTRMAVLNQFVLPALAAGPGA